MSFDVVVIGSINYDISVFAERHPAPGESVLGTDHFTALGGKGANQAVAAARLGARVAMIGRVGDDDWGRESTRSLADEGIDVSMVGVDRERATGIALITIDSTAENTIVVSAGANTGLGPDEVAAHADAIASAGVVLAQLEVPLETAAAVGSLVQGVFCLNPAPAHPLPAKVLDGVDVLIPNRSELALLAGVESITSPEEAIEAAISLRPGRSTVVTLGAEGAVLVEGNSSSHYPPYQVKAVDPTGAGDAFCGALAASISAGSSLSDAVRVASAAGALAVTRAGARAGMPDREQVESLIAG